MYQQILLIEAGLPSGTFSTADEAIAAGRDVLVVPGAITSKRSRGANRLLYQGAIPIVDDESFADQLASLFGCLEQQQQERVGEGEGDEACVERANATGSPEAAIERCMLEAVRAEPLDLEALKTLAQQERPAGEALTWLMVWIAKAQRQGLIAQYPDGRYGPVLSERRAAR